VYGPSNDAPTNAGDYTAQARYMGDANHLDSHDAKDFSIAKATSSIVVSGGGSFVFDGGAHGATVHVSGAGGLSLDPAPVYSGPCSAAPVHVADTPCTASYTYSGDANHEASNGSAVVTITKAPSVTTIGAGYTVIYNALPHAVTANVTGVGGLNQSVPITYAPGGSTTPLNPGSYSAIATYPGDGDHTGSSAGPVTIIITYGVCSAGVGPGGVILQPINSDGTSVYQRKGGSTIPVKFTVCDAFGNSHLQLGAVFAGTVGSLTMLSEVRGTITV